MVELQALHDVELRLTRTASASVLTPVRIFSRACERNSTRLYAITSSSLLAVLSATGASPLPNAPASEVTSFRRVEAANAPRTAGQWAQPLGRWCLTWGGGAPPQPKQMLPNTSILNVHGVAALMQPCGRRPKRLAGGGTDACIDAVDGDDGHEEGNG